MSSRFFSTSLELSLNSGAVIAAMISDVAVSTDMVLVSGVVWLMTFRISRACLQFEDVRIVNFILHLILRLKLYYNYLFTILPLSDQNRYCKNLSLPCSTA